MSRFSLFLALLVSAAFSSFICPLAGCSQDSPKVAPAPETPAEPEPAPLPPSATTTGGDLGYGDDARLFATPAQAMRTLLAELGRSEKPRVIGFGEYHKLTSSADVHSALRRFAESIFDVLAKDSAHLILETWQIDPACGKTGQEVRKQVEATIERPPETESEMAMLLRKAQASATQPHALHFECNEYQKLLGAEGLDPEALLTAIRTKLQEKALEALKAGPTDKLVLIYGGATHNNLFPYKGLEHWSFAKALARATEQRYLEIDLYVPELVKGDPLLSQEPWYPLLKEARADEVILVRRDPASYILILRQGFGSGGNPPLPAPPKPLGTRAP